MKGKKILVTAGPCREPLDPVRYISNRSSGKMGYAIAEQAVAMGATVTLVSGPTRLKPPDEVSFVSVETTDQMHRAVKAHFKKSDCLIMAAAPADYALVNPASQKMKKSGDNLALELAPTVDILKEVAAAKRKSQYVVGFALETENGIENARKKLRAKNLDLIVLNNPNDDASAFDHETNRVTILAPKTKPDPWPLMAKSAVSEKLLALVAARLKKS